MRHSLEDDKTKGFLDRVPGLFEVPVGNHAQVIKRKIVEGLVKPVIRTAVRNMHTPFPP
jgi:hypothetical protein